jgi:hypothetical protein
MRKLAILSAGILSAALPATAALADVDVDARIVTTASISSAGARRIQIDTSNFKVGVCGLQGTVRIRSATGALLCTYNITRSSVLEAFSSPIGLHTSGASTDCVGPANTANPLVVVDLVDNPGVTVKFTPGNGTPASGSCGTFTATSYTFCTMDNTSSGCTTPVRRFDLRVGAD